MVYEVSKDIQGLIFDFDGTLVDSMPVHCLSWKAAFAAFNEDISESFIYGHAGYSLVGVVEAYNKQKKKNLPPLEVVAKKDESHLAYVDKTKPIPIVLDIVKHYYKKLPMAVATGNTRLLTAPLMKKLDLMKYFDTVVFGDEVTKGKPDPECFLVAAKAIGVLPQNCEVFEDGDPGIEAAKRAGMKVTDVRKWLS